MISDEVLTYAWPDVYVPRNVRISQHITEKFRFYADQQFVTSDETGLTYLYKNVYHDSRRVAYRLTDGQKSGRNVAIVGANTFESVVAIFGALMADTTIILLDANITEAQLDIAIDFFQPIIFVTPDATKGHRLDERFKRLYTLACGEEKKKTGAIGDTTKIYYLAESSGMKHKKGKSFFVPAFCSTAFTDRVVIPIFRRSCLVNIYRVSELGLMTQLTYTTLPQTGFEWNINDVILNTRPFSSLVGLLELLVTFTVGARLVLPSAKLVGGLLPTAALVENVACYEVSSCLLHSRHLLELLKSRQRVEIRTLRKVIYTEQPIHRALVSEFKIKFSLQSCRFALYLLQTCGFAAIEVQQQQFRAKMDDGDQPLRYNLVAPLPLTEVKIEPLSLDDGGLGKIFIRCKYLARIDRSYRPPRDGWVYTGLLGFNHPQQLLQVIDYYPNFLHAPSGRMYSKTLFEAVVLARWPSVRWAEIRKRPRTRLGKIEVNMHVNFYEKKNTTALEVKKIVDYLSENCPDRETFVWKISPSSTSDLN